MVRKLTVAAGARVGICVPTLNAGGGWKQWLEAVVAGAPAGARLLVIDSESADSTVSQARDAGFDVVSIKRSAFNHGAVRQQAVEILDDCDVVVFLTQDALPENAGSLAALCRAFDNSAVGAAYGRQIPHASAKPLGAHARYFNYPEQSYTRCHEDISRFGIKTAFISNSFAAYRRTALQEIGGFPERVILGEDMVTAARMLLKGWCVSYVAEARVYHSHDYTHWQEFKRYFDIGVFHAQENWLLEAFGKPEGEGRRYIRSELSYLLRHAPFLLPSAMLRTVLKYAGYRLGRLERSLPHWLKRRCSMHKGYWENRKRLILSNHSR